MALPPSGPISLNQVNTELGRPATQTLSLGSPEVRALAQVPSGPISMSNLYGKSSEFNATVASNVGNLNLRNFAISQGWDQTAKLTLTINSGIVVGSSDTGSAALIINGSFPNGLFLVNNGSIVGRGGNGGNGDSQAGFAGGAAINSNIDVTLNVNNANGIIAGGGGGGGGGAAQTAFKFLRNGSGGGGGRSTDQYQSAGGAAGTQGTPGAGPGAPGTYAGAGGPGGVDGGGQGGAGGNWGANGANGAGANGGAAGAAIIKNAGIVYFEAQGQIFGAIV